MEYMEYVSTHGQQVRIGDYVELRNGAYQVGTVIEVRHADEGAVVRVLGTSRTVTAGVQYLTFIRSSHTRTSQAMVQGSTSLDPGAAPVLYLLLAGKIDAEDVTILGFYNKPPGQYSLGDLGLKPGGSRYGALAKAFGVTVEELQESEVRGGIGGDMRPEFLWVPSESTPSTGCVRIVPVVDGMAYTVSNAYNF